MTPSDMPGLDKVDHRAKPAGCQQGRKLSYLPPYPSRSRLLQFAGSGGLAGFRTSKRSKQHGDFIELLARLAFGRRKMPVEHQAEREALASSGLHVTGKGGCLSQRACLRLNIALGSRLLHSIIQRAVASGHGK